MKIVNCCPHTVNIYSNAVFDPATKMYRGGSCIASIPPSGFLASAKVSVEFSHTLESDNSDIPVYNQEVVKISELPEDADFYIVSAMYAQACRRLKQYTGKLLVPYGIVVDEGGKKVGCVALTVGPI